MAGAAGERVCAEWQHAGARAIKARHRPGVALTAVLRQLLRTAEGNQAPLALPLLAQMVVAPARQRNTLLGTPTQQGLFWV